MMPGWRFFSRSPIVTITFSIGKVWLVANDSVFSVSCTSAYWLNDWWLAPQTLRKRCIRIAELYCCEAEYNISSAQLQFEQVANDERYSCIRLFWVVCSNVYCRKNK